MTNAGSEIHHAELSRVKGDFRGAIERAREKSSLTANDIANTPAEALPNLMRMWRIWEVSLLSAEQLEWNGERAGGILRQARELVDKYYYNEEVWVAANKMKTDESGAEYQMAAEMCRDEGKLHLYTYRLTGNPDLLDKAIDSFDEAIVLAEKGTSAFGVATMEREMAVQETGEEMDFDKFKETYCALVNLPRGVVGWDRLATVSWWYAKESLRLGIGQEALFGLSNLVSAGREGGQNIGKFPLKDIIRPIMDIVRRATYRAAS